MSDESIFWIIVSLVLGLTTATGIFLGVDYWKDHNAKIVELVKSGISPVEAKCAMQNDYGTHPTCIIIATKQTIK